MKNVKLKIKERAALLRAAGLLFSRLLKNPEKV
jgi:hypothetical protein